MINYQEFLDYLDIIYENIEWDKQLLVDRIKDELIRNHEAYMKSLDTQNEQNM